MVKLADEWRHAWKWLQTWLIAALGVAPLIYDQMAPLQEVLPAAWFKSAMGVLAVLTVVNNVRKK